MRYCELGGQDPIPVYLRRAGCLETMQLSVWVLSMRVGRIRKVEEEWV